MKQIVRYITYLLIFIVPATAYAGITIYVNQVALDSKGPKMAVICADNPLTNRNTFSLIDAVSGKIVFTGATGIAMQVEEWLPGKFCYQANFSPFTKSGQYKIAVAIAGTTYTSAAFTIGDNALAMLTIPSILHYYNKQRANTAQELAADKQLLLFGSNTTVDLRGGWCDASGDVSKYFSHLAYANFMSPQQIPLVTWSLANATENLAHLLTQQGIKDAMEQEALWGADYLMRSLSPDGYFYMTVFSYFKPNPGERRVVGLLANSVTTSDYQCAFREGGGMAIAALARVARWQQHGDFTNSEYLAAAKRAFDHLLKNNTRYTDDGKENIIDDYCALMAATELWMTTDDSLYSNEARKRARHLIKRMTPEGYFIANDANRPFWHASDAGLPVIALARYLKKETANNLRQPVLVVIKQALDYQLRINRTVSNPFDYARQTFLYQNNTATGFFIPHNNETGWWWQGENARLASLAAMAIAGGRLVYPAKGGWGIKDSLAAFASQQLSWIMGCNPYDMCFMYGFGKQNVPYMASQFGHGSEKGGISNGITGKDGNGDGSGIDFKIHADGNEWRWTEQWLPHAAWFLVAVTAMAGE